MFQIFGNFNKNLFFDIYHLSLQNSLIDTLMIFGAVNLIYVIFILMLILYILGDPRDKKAIFLTLTSFIISQIVLRLIHLIFYEPRPFITFHLTPLIQGVPNPSFPSEHTTTLFVFAFSYFFCRSRFKMIFMIFAIWTGLARIYVGVHYPLDILGGILLGLISVLIARKVIFQKVLKI